jgi:hypothetical protein
VWVLAPTRFASALCEEHNVPHLFEGVHANEPLLCGQDAMIDREHIADDQDESVAGTAQPHFEVRTHSVGPRALQILNPSDAECLHQDAGVASGSLCSEIDGQLAPVLEPLKMAATGREAVQDMLLGVLSADLSTAPGSNASLPALLHFSVDTDSTLQTSRACRHSLQSQIHQRLEHSVSEGELPECADVQVLSCLCMSFMSGLAVSLQDGIPKECLEDSIPLFVESVGFHKVRIPKRRERSTSPVQASGLRLVKR